MNFYTISKNENLLNHTENPFLQLSKKMPRPGMEPTQIACILAASLIFSGYYLVMTSLSCHICGKTPAKLTES